ncbi:MAG: hypothetical protein K0S71_2323 [Clostridia bacterium]|jgi:septal ring factor EnvC (AmiA/AmiB activator)|nr:hypothetical protein [Clostridia bacterium]
MNSINKLKFLVSIMLMVPIMFSSTTLGAAMAPASPSPAEHKEIIYEFISEIKNAQDQSITIAQSASKGSANSNNELQLQIYAIGNDLLALNERIEDYADSVQGLSEQDRQVRLTFNFLNLVRSNLYTLSSLARAATDVQRIQLLDEFFRTRINAFNILTILESNLENYNT